jgi:hypothetical protein
MVGWDLDHGQWLECVGAGPGSSSKPQGLSFSSGIEHLCLTAGVIVGMQLQAYEASV